MSIGFIIWSYDSLVGLFEVFLVYNVVSYHVFWYLDFVSKVRVTIGLRLFDIGVVKSRHYDFFV